MNNLFPLSIIIHTKNSADTLEKCLDSAKFAEEIVIVDMQSSDDTKKIAQRFTHKFFTVEDSGFVETVRNFGIEKASQHWVLLLDADEEISDGLKVWLQSFLTGTTDKEKAAAYFIPRKNIIFGQELKNTGWWPDYQLRLFKNGTVKWNTQIHSQPEVTGKTEKLPANPEHAIIHYNYKSVEQFVDRMNRYTSIAASQQGTEMPISSKQVIETFSNEFVRRMFVWDGKNDGSLGLSLALLQSTYELLTLMKRWEKNKFFEKNTDEEANIAAVSKMKQTLEYWLADWYVQHSSGLLKIKWMIKRRLARIS